MTEPLLRVENLTKSYEAKRRFGGKPRKLTVRGVSFDLERGGTLGVVGESGSGKSTLASCILRLTEPDGGRVLFDGVDVRRLGAREMRQLRRRMQMVFQDPYGSLDPRYSVRELVEEPLLVHGVRDAEQRRTQAIEMLERVGIGQVHVDRNAHAFSGGQRQRIAIARALVLNPELVVLDEPVTALDVSVQAQVLNLLTELQRDLNLTYLFIVHDLAVARHMCHRIAVMYLGEIVELAEADELFSRPLHPYTEALLQAAPIPDPAANHPSADADVATPGTGQTRAADRPAARATAPDDDGVDPPVPGGLVEVLPGHWVASSAASALTAPHSRED